MAPHGSTVAIEPEQAAAIFAEFAAAEELALEFPADGCYARTHLMVQRLLGRGLAPLKAWAFAASAADLLWTEAPGHPDGRVQWGYHVAPGLLVRTPDGDTREMVFDPFSSTARSPSRSGGARSTTPRLSCGRPPGNRRCPRTEGPDTGPDPTPSKGPTCMRAIRSKSTEGGALDGAQGEGVAPWSKH
jgi:hypothetical protein